MQLLLRTLADGKSQAGLCMGGTCECCAIVDGNDEARFLATRHVQEDDKTAGNAQGNSTQDKRT